MFSISSQIIVPIDSGLFSLWYVIESDNAQTKINCIILTKPKKKKMNLDSHAKITYELLDIDNISAGALYSRTSKHVFISRNRPKYQKYF